MKTACDKRSNIPTKRQRKKHLIAGPAGLWFQRQQEQSKQFSVTTTANNAKKTIQNGSKIVDDLCADQSNDATAALSSNRNKKNTKNTQNSFLFGDTDTRLLRSDVAQTWDCMCLSLQRFVIPRHQHTFLFHHIKIPGNPLNSSNVEDEAMCANIMEMEYFSYHIVRKCVSEEYTLLYEVLHPSLLRPAFATLTSEQVRKWSTLPREQSGLVIPQIILQIEHVFCHGHCDWTVELVDESVMDKNSFFCHSSGGNGGSSNKICKGSILGWVEESFVKKNPAWIRPGVVLFCKNVSLAVFPSTEDEDAPGGDLIIDTSMGEGMNGDTMGNVCPRQTSGEMNFIDDLKVDRMLLLGEDSIIYAWTPEEATDEVSNDKFLFLMEMRAAMFSVMVDESTDEPSSKDDHSKKSQRFMIERVQNSDGARIKPSFTRPSKIPMDRTNIQQLKISPSTRAPPKKNSGSVASSIWINHDKNNGGNLPDTSPVSSVSNPTNSNLGMGTSVQSSSNPNKMLSETRNTPLPPSQIHNLAISAPASSDSTITCSCTETTPLLSKDSKPVPGTTPCQSNHGSTSSTYQSRSTNLTRTPLSLNTENKIVSPGDSIVVTANRNDDRDTAVHFPDRTLTDKPRDGLLSCNNSSNMDPVDQPELGLLNHQQTGGDISREQPSRRILRRIHADDSDPLHAMNYPQTDYSSVNKSAATIELPSSKGLGLDHIDLITFESSFRQQPSMRHDMISNTRNNSRPSLINFWSSMTVDEINALHRLLEDDINTTCSSPIRPQLQSLDPVRKVSTQSDDSTFIPLKGLGQMNLDNFHE